MAQKKVKDYMYNNVFPVYITEENGLYGWGISVDDEDGEEYEPQCESIEEAEEDANRAAESYWHLYKDEILRNNSDRER